MADTVGVLSDRNDERTLRWLTNGDIQRLTQSCRETSSSSTKDDLDDSGLKGCSLGQQKLMAR